jgi:heterodisulfide reductase subunit A-like polyferredoxin
MIKKLFLVLLLLKCSFTYAQTIKTDILVIGGGAAGSSAAIQGARSKIKTVLIEAEPAIVSGYERSNKGIYRRRTQPAFGYLG